MIHHIVAQHNTVIVSTTTEDLFGMAKGPCNVQIDSVNLECGTGYRPAIYALRYGVSDPENRLRGSLTWHKPWGKQEFPVNGAKHFTITNFGRHGD